MLTICPQKIIEKSFVKLFSHLTSPSCQQNQGSHIPYSSEGFRKKLTTADFVTLMLLIKSTMMLCFATSHHMVSLSHSANGSKVSPPIVKCVVNGFSSTLFEIVAVVLPMDSYLAVFKTYVAEGITSFHVTSSLF